MGLKKGFLIICMFLLLSTNVFALTFTKADFGYVQPGERKVQTAILGGDHQANTYLIGTEGELADWVEISPKKVTIEAKKITRITVVMNVPEDATPGYHEGMLVASAVNPVGAETAEPIEGGNMVGFKLQVKSLMMATVNRSGNITTTLELDDELDDPYFTVLDFNVESEEVKAGEKPKVDVRLVNSGKVAAPGSVFIDIRKGGETIDTQSTEINNLRVAEERNVTLYLETKGLEKGVYELYAYAKPSGSVRKPQEFGPANLVVLEGGRSTSGADIFWGSLLFLLIILLLVAIYESYKNNKEKIHEFFSSITKKKDKPENIEIKQVFKEQPKEDIFQEIADARKKPNTKDSEKEIRKVINDVHKRLDSLIKEEEKYKSMISSREEEISKLKGALIDLSNRFERHVEPKPDEMQLLTDFVKKALKQGYSAEDIERKMVEKKWSKEKVTEVFKRVINEMKGKHI